MLTLTDSFWRSESIEKLYRHLERKGGGSTESPSSCSLYLKHFVNIPFEASYITLVSSLKLRNEHGNAYAGINIAYILNDPVSV
jgi:hypothetical protein